MNHARDRCSLGLILLQRPAQGNDQIGILGVGGTTDPRQQKYKLVTQERATSAMMADLICSRQTPRTNGTTEEERAIH